MREAVAQCERPFMLHLARKAFVPASCRSGVFPAEVRDAAVVKLWGLIIVVAGPAWSRLRPG